MRFKKPFPTALKTALAVTICASACWLASGCGRKVVLVPPGEPVRLRQPVKKVKIWAADKDGFEIPGEVDLPEGWYALPDPGPGPSPSPSNGKE